MMFKSNQAVLLQQVCGRTIKPTSKANPGRDVRLHASNSVTNLLVSIELVHEKVAIIISGETCNTSSSFRTKCRRCCWSANVFGFCVMVLVISTVRSVHNSKKTSNSQVQLCVDWSRREACVQGINDGQERCTNPI